MNKIKIRFGNWQQPFIQIDVEPSVSRLSLADAIVIKNDTPSLVLRLPDKQQILKFIRARHWVEFAKMLWNRSRVTKEVKGNRLLAAIGIRVPVIKGVGLGWLPCKGYQFIGYYIMEDLESRDFCEAKACLQEHKLTPEIRQRFIHNMLTDITRMYQNRIVFNDLKLGNIFCNSAGDVIWIDTGISKYPFYQQAKLELKFQMALARFLKRHQTLFTDDEVSTIRQHFAASSIH